MKTCLTRLWHGLQDPVSTVKTCLTGLWHGLQDPVSTMKTCLTGLWHSLQVCAQIFFNHDVMMIYYNYIRNLFGCCSSYLYQMCTYKPVFGAATLLFMLQLFRWSCWVSITFWTAMTIRVRVDARCSTWRFKILRIQFFITAVAPPMNTSSKV